MSIQKSGRKSIQIDFIVAQKWCEKKAKKIDKRGFKNDSELIENNSLRYLQFCVKLEWF